MEMIGAFEAQTHLASPLNRMAKGEKLTISRHGIPAAMLVLVSETAAKLSYQKIVE